MKDMHIPRNLHPVRGPLLGLLFLLLVPGSTAFGAASPTQAPPPAARLMTAQAVGSVGRIITAPTGPGIPHLVLLLDAEAPVASLWNADTGHVLLRFEGHSESIADAAFSSDARRLVTADTKGELRIWDLMTGSGQVLGQETEGQPAMVRFSTDGRWIVSGSTTGRLRRWEIPSREQGDTEGTAFGTSAVHGPKIACLQFSPDGRFLLSGDVAGGGVLWDTSTWQPVQQLQPLVEVDSHGHYPRLKVSCQRDGRQLLRGGFTQVEVWDLATGRSARQLQLGSGHVILEVSPDFQEVLVGLDDGTLATWSLTRGERLQTVRESSEAGADSYKGDPLTRVLETRVFRRNQEAWHFNAQQWHAVRLLSGVPSTLRGKASTGSNPADFRDPLKEPPSWAPDGSYAVLRYASRVEVWKPASTSGQTPTFAPAIMLEGAQVLTPQMLSFSPVESNRLLLATGEGILLWDAASASSRREVSPIFPGPRGLPRSPFAPVLRAGAAFTPDGKYIVSFNPSGGSWDSLPLFRTSVETDTVTSGSETDPESIALSGRLTLTPSPFGRRVVDHTGWYVVPAARGEEPITAAWLMAARTGSGGARQDPYQVLGSYKDQSLMALSPDGRFVVTQGTRVKYEPSTSALFIYDTQSGAQLGRTEPLGTGGITGVVISPNGKFMVAFGGTNTQLWDIGNPKAPRRAHTFPYPAQPAFSKKGDMLLLGVDDGALLMWSMTSLLGKGHDRAAPVRTFPADGSPIPGHSGSISHLDFSADDRFLVSAGDESKGDRTVRLWDTRTGLELCKLFSFTDGTWAVVDPLGRYDASNGGETDWLYWVVGFDTIGLSQLKSRYYEPGLLRRLMGYSSDDLRAVERIDMPRLAPDVTAQVQGAENTPTLRITLTERGGGIGRTLVSINDKEVLHLGWDRSGKPRVESVAPDSAKQARCEGKSSRLTCDIPLAPLFRYFQTQAVRLPGSQAQPALRLPVNRISVEAYNDTESLLSKPVTFEYSPPRAGSRGSTDVELPVTPSELVVPRLWAVVAGVSDYTGKDIDLRFAAKDADDFARALEVAARRLLCSAEDIAAGKTCDRVHIRRLSTTAGNQERCLSAPEGSASNTPRFTDPEEDGRSCSLKPAQGLCAPGKMNLLRALEELEQAAPQDIVVVYLAGHGAVFNKGNLESYHYLTQDAGSLDLKDANLRCGGTLSSASLNAVLKKSPAMKQVLILDTCASGAMVGKLPGSRGVSPSQVRAMEQMKDQTGMYVLAGAPSDAVSYESPEFGQGVLTYSLLKGMSAEGLAEESLVDVGRLFDYASKKVPELARDMNRAQRPVMAMPRGGGSFFIGQVTQPEQGTILKNLVQTPRPRFVIPNFSDRKTWVDSSGVKAAVVSELRDRGGSRQQSAPAFVDIAELPGTYQLVGQYGKTTAAKTKQESLEVASRVVKDGKQVGCEFRVTTPLAKRGSVPSQQELKTLASALVSGAMKELERAKATPSPVCKP